MGISQLTTGLEGTMCPACGTALRTASVTAGGQVQCPGCRVLVALVAPSMPPGGEAGGSRLAALEARLASLEKALAAAQPELNPPSGPKFRWVADQSATPYSAAQAEVLCHNLSIISPHPIIIQVVRGDVAARIRANWFKMVFELAHWPVQGPEDAVPGETQAALTMATQLPVPPEAAATYLAIRAAGFDLVTIFDPNCPDACERLIVW